MSAFDPLLVARVSFHMFVFAAALRMEAVKLESKHDEDAVSMLGFHGNNHLSSTRRGTCTPFRDALPQACELPERHLQPTTL